jgi:hypothetical protein
VGPRASLDAWRTNIFLVRAEVGLRIKSQNSFSVSYLQTAVCKCMKDKQSQLDPLFFIACCIWRLLYRRPVVSLHYALFPTLVEFLLQNGPRIIRLDWRREWRCFVLFLPSPPLTEGAESECWQKLTIHGSILVACDHRNHS